MHVPIDVVYNRLPIPEQSMGNVDQWIVEAMENLKVYPALEHTAEFIPIENFKGTLPDNIIKIAYVAKVEVDDPPTCDDCESTGDSTVDCTCCDSVEQAATSAPVGLAETQVCRIRHQGITYVYDYYAFMHNSYVASTLEIMRHKSIPFRNHSSECTECPDLASTCSETYEILRNQIIVSFEEGNICIDYYKLPTDDEGNLLVYDNSTYIQYLADYVMYKYHESRWNTNKEGSEKRMLFYLDKYITMKKRVQGELALELHDIEQIRAQIYKDSYMLKHPAAWNSAPYYRN